MRGLMEKTVGVHHEAHLPEFHTRTLVGESRKRAPQVNRNAPAFGRKAVIYATCYGNYNNPEIGEATRAVLARNGVETEVLHPGCCAMPWLEQGNLEQVAAQARKVAAEFGPWVDRGYRIVTLVPSCALMLRSEWPLLLPEDKAVAKLADAVMDVAEYVVDISKNEGMADGLEPLPGGVAVHWACHARAQYIGPMAMQMLRLIPDADLEVIDRCSGHGGAWGVKKEHFETALKVGRPVVRKAQNSDKAFLASECPLAGAHIVQGLARQGDGVPAMTQSYHPIQLLARAYGMPEGGAGEAT